MKHWLTALALVWWLPCPAAPPDDARPQLTAEQAQRRTVADYLGAGPQPWEPAPIDVAALQPDLVVAADGSGSHRTLQAAIDALPAPTSGARRQVILVRPGTYRGQVCARDKVPFVLHGLPGQAAATVLVAGHYAGQSKRADIDAANPCEPALAQSRYGTSGSASVALYGDDIVMAHLTVANDAMDRVAAGAGAPAGVDLATGAQAVALMLRGDRILLEHVRLIGHQDTLYVKAPAPGAPARMLMRHSLIAGDVDFVFGNATLVIDNSVLLSRAGRTGGRGIVLAPSTLPGQDYGFLVIRTRQQRAGNFRGHGCRARKCHGIERPWAARGTRACRAANGWPASPPMARRWCVTANSARTSGPGSRRLRSGRSPPRVRPPTGSSNTATGLRQAPRHHEVSLRCSAIAAHLARVALCVRAQRLR